MRFDRDGRAKAPNQPQPGANVAWDSLADGRYNVGAVWFVTISLLTVRHDLTCLP